MDGLTFEQWKAMTPEEQWEIVQQLAFRITQLEAKLAENPRNSSRPPSTEHPHARPKRQRKPSGKKHGGQHGHRKHSRNLVEPAQLTRTVVLKPTHCRRCGEELAGEDSDPKRHQVWDLPPIVPIIIEYQRHSLSCSCSVTTTAPLPSGVPTGQFGPNVIALTAALSAHYRQSKRQIALFLESVFGLPISTGQVCRLQKLTAKALATPCDELRDWLRKQAVLGMDETPWKQQDQRPWLWQIQNEQASFYSIQSHRNTQAAQNLLGEFQGVVITDRLGSYDWLPAHRRQLCWAHLLRDFQSLIDADGAGRTAAETLKTCAETLFHHWRRFRQKTISQSTLRRHLFDLQAQVYAALEEGLHSGDPNWGKFQHIWERFDSLWTFKYQADVEPTNNATERGLRAGVIWRKLSFGTQSGWGSSFVERMLSVIDTCRKQSRNVLEYLQETMRNHLTQKPAPSLIPLG